jgi:hypothetical protein
MERIIIIPSCSNYSFLFFPIFNHKAKFNQPMKNTLSNSKVETVTRQIVAYSQNSYCWFINTPNRALNKAYQAALNIKSLENEYLTAKEKTKTANNDNSSILECILSDIDKCLAIIKINLAEFKVSRFFLNQSDSKNWDKLIVIDEVINKYRTDLTETSIIPDVNSIEKAQIKDDFHQVNPITEKTGVLPRSLGRTVKKIKTDFKRNSEEETIQTFRRQRRITQAAVRCILLLIIIPIFTQQLSKEFLISPLVKNYREVHQAAIFVNLEMKEEAFRELQDFEEEIKFNNLINLTPEIEPEVIEEKLKEKAQELAIEFREKGDNAISNVFADFIGVVAFAIVAFTNRRGIAAIKSFLDSIIYDLSDTAKAFIIILFTDIFVGFHSPHGWEVLLEGLANHLGIQPNHSAIFLFIATFPVILDTILKYWIFRYLNRISPSAVATLKNMNE